MPYADIASYLEAIPGEFRILVKALRKIIISADKRLKERIKWNAPSYYFIEDLVTFGPIRKEKMVLVFHHPSVVKINSPVLEGNYKDRRLFWFNSLNEIESAKKELVNSIRFIISDIDKNQNKARLKTKSSLKTCKHGHSYYKSSDCPVCPKCENLRISKTNVFSSLSAPARRALENEGITSLKKLSGYTLKKILGLHGIGPSSIPKLQNLLSIEGLTFKQK